MRGILKGSEAMAKWRVTMYGVCNCEQSTIVEADSEEQAKAKALDTDQPMWTQITYAEEWHDDVVIEADLITEEWLDK